MQGSRTRHARVSNRDQDPAAQERELRAAGVVRCSSTMASRVGYGTGRSESLAWTTCGLVTPLWCGLWIGSPARRRWRSRITELPDRGVNIKSLTEPDIGTTTPMERPLFGIVAVFAQLRV